MKKIGLKAIPVAIGLLTVATFAGSISGSLAWWAYSTRVTVSYQGTSVSTSEQLQIGIKLDATRFNDSKVEQLTDLGLEEDDTLRTASYRYVFAKAGGGLPADTISTYLTAEGVYSHDELAPVTSRTYTTGDELTLYESLIAGHAKNTDVALTSKYVYVPFVFRILKLNAVSVEDKYADGRDIYLSKILAEAGSSNPDSDIADGIRVYFDNGTGSNRFILDVGDKTENDTSSVDVCGFLDLSKSGQYDIDENKKEILYGDYTGTLTDSFVPEETATTLSNINNVDVEGLDLTDIVHNHTTFLSTHGKGNTCYNSYAGITKGKAQYKTMHSIKPDDTKAQLEGGLPLCTTASESGNYLAELDTTIWLEGWDHAVVDSKISHKFNLGLQFQIDLVS